MEIEKLICKEIHKFFKEHIDEVENKLTIWCNKQSCYDCTNLNIY